MLSIRSLVFGAALSMPTGTAQDSSVEEATSNLTWRTDWEQARADAAEAHRPMLIVFR